VCAGWPKETQTEESPGEALYWDFAETARKLCTTTNWIRTLVWEHKLTPIKMGKRFVFDPAEVRAFARRWKLEGVEARVKFSEKQSRAGAKRQNKREEREGV
jgi:hypothetical protein